MTAVIAAPTVLDDMVWIPGGTFVMGSGSHYPKEAPAHRVRLDGFWLDRTPVTDAQFRRFAEATGHVTFSEIAPDAKDFAGTLPHMLKGGLGGVCAAEAAGESAEPHELVDVQLRH